MAGIYRVRVDGAPDRFVDAKSKVDAFVHVASEYFNVELLSNADLRAAVKAGVAVESTTKAAPAKTEEPAAAEPAAEPEAA